MNETYKNFWATIDEITEFMLLYTDDSSQCQKIVSAANAWKDVIKNFDVVIREKVNKHTIN